MQMPDLSRTRHLPIALLLAAAFLLGMITAPDYGESWDEHDIRRYSEHAIDAYNHLLQPGDLAPFETNLNLYGPAYFMAAGLLARLITALVPVWSTITAWHAVYFVTFLTGALFLYLLAGRWMSEWAAFRQPCCSSRTAIFWVMHSSIEGHCLPGFLRGHRLPRPPDGGWHRVGPQDGLESGVAAIFGTHKFTEYSVRSLG
jgi:hypothetical protein